MAKATLAEAEEAWRKGAKGASKKWADEFKRVETFDKWANGIASKDPSISASAVKSSTGGKRFDAAQSRVDASDFEKGIDAVRPGKWKDGWVRAWSQ